MKVLIVGSSKLPVPAVKGGAVPNLIEQLIRQNEQEEKIDLTCCSLYDSDAMKETEKYGGTKFIWAKQPGIIRFLDKVFGFIIGKVFRLKRLLSLSYLFQVIWLSFFVANVLRKGNYDRVVFENSVPVLFSLRLWGNKRKYAGKYYFHIHSVPRKYYGNADIIRDCKSLICVSCYVANEMLQDRRLGIKAEKVRIMYNCIDTKVFSCSKQPAIDVRAKHGIGPDMKIVLFIGRLCQEKGIAELLQTVKQMKRADIFLLVVGSNFYKSGIVSAYETYLQSLLDGIEDQVIFTGYVDYQDVSSYYVAADVIALPSMWDEPAGMTMVEAMACGRPLVTTVSGGIPEYAGEGNCIMLERNESIVTNLAETISDLLEDTKKASEYAQKAARWASQYNLKFYYDQFLKIIDV